jgi:hypothetical protein
VELAPGAELDVEVVFRVSAAPSGCAAPLAPLRCWVEPRLLLGDGGSLPLRPRMDGSAGADAAGWRTGTWRAGPAPCGVGASLSLFRELRFAICVSGGADGAVEADADIGFVRVALLT